MAVGRRGSGRTVDETADADLVLRSRSGDTAAFGELWRRHYASGIAVARSITSSLDPDDLVQEAYARIFRAIQRGGGPTGAFRAYLFTSIRNTAAAWGRARREVAIDELDAVADPTTDEQAANDALDRGLTNQAFRTLPTRWQEVLWYTEIEQLRPAEVAPLLGMKPNAVAQLAVRAREGLREAWIQAHLRSVAAGSECRWTIDRLGAYARGNLGRRDRGRLDRHLHDCARCAIVAEEARDVSDRLALILLPLTLGTAATGYAAWLQSGAPVTAALAMPLGVAPGGGASGGVAGSGAAGGGAAGSVAAGSAASVGATVGLVAAGVVVAATITVGAVLGPRLLAAPTVPAAVQATPGAQATSPGAPGAPGADAGAPVTSPPVAVPPVAVPPVAAPGVTAPGVAVPPTAVPPVAAPPVAAPPVSAPPVVAPPVTAPPVTAPPVTAPPVTAPPVTPPPVTPPPVTAPPPPPPAASLPPGAPTFGGATVATSSGSPVVTLTIRGAAGATVQVVFGANAPATVVIGPGGTATVTLRPTPKQIGTDTHVQLRYSAGPALGPKAKQGIRTIIAAAS